jgi:prepilin-type processing-associated H-X9-DG protein
MGALPPAYKRVQAAGRSRALLSWFDQLLPYIEQESLWRLTLAAKRADPYGFANPPHVGVTTAVLLYTCPSDDRLTVPLTDDAGFTAAYSSYLGVTGGLLVLGPPLPVVQEGAMEHLGTGIRMTAITDGTSQTLLVGERTPPGRLFAGSWYHTGAPHPAWGDLLASICSVTRIEGDIGACKGPFRFGPGRVENLCDAYHFWSLHPGGANFLFADGSARFLGYAAEPVMVALGTRAGGEIGQPFE